MQSLCVLRVCFAWVERGGFAAGWCAGIRSGSAGSCSKDLVRLGGWCGWCGVVRILRACGALVQARRVVVLLLLRCDFGEFGVVVVFY